MTKTHLIDYSRLLGQRPIAKCGHVGPCYSEAGRDKVTCKRCLKAA